MDREYPYEFFLGIEYHAEKEETLTLRYMCITGLNSFIQKGQTNDQCLFVTNSFDSPNKENKEELLFSFTKYCQEEERKRDKLGQTYYHGSVPIFLSYFRFDENEDEDEALLQAEEVPDPHESGSETSSSESSESEDEFESPLAAGTYGRSRTMR